MRSTIGHVQSRVLVLPQLELAVLENTLQLAKLENTLLLVQSIY